MKSQVRRSPLVCVVLAVLILCGELPLLAAARSAPAQDGLWESRAAVTALRGELAEELFGTSLELLDVADVRRVDANVTQVTLQAVAATDFVRGGALFHQRQVYLTPGEERLETAAVVDIAATIDVERDVVQLSQQVRFEKGIDASREQELLTGLAFETSLEVPLAEFRAIAEAGDPSSAASRVAAMLGGDVTERVKTVVTGPSGARVAFQGTKMTLADAVGTVLQGDAFAPEGPCWDLVVYCFKEHGIPYTSTFGVICTMAVVAACTAACFFVGPLCAACYAPGLTACGIGTGVFGIGFLIGCLVGGAVYC